MVKKVENKVEYKTLDELYHLDHNPRTISKANMDKLVQSIKDNPDYFEARPIICSDRTGRLVIIAGNQRLRAAGLAGLSEVPVIVIHGLTEEREREITIRDNVELGDWDMDILANEWNVEDLEKWGVKTPQEQMQELSDEYSQLEGKIIAEEPDEPVAAKDCLFMDDDYYEKLAKIQKIEDEDLKNLLLTRLAYFADINFEKVAGLWYQSDKETKKLLENLGLVILDKDGLIENGFSDLVGFDFEEAE